MPQEYTELYCVWKINRQFEQRCFFEISFVVLANKHRYNPGGKQVTHSRSNENECGKPGGGRRSSGSNSGAGGGAAKLVRLLGLHLVDLGVDRVLDGVHQFLNPENETQEQKRRHRPSSYLGDRAVCCPSKQYAQQCRRWRGVAPHHPLLFSQGGAGGNPQHNQQIEAQHIVLPGYQLFTAPNQHAAFQKDTQHNRPSGLLPRRRNKAIRYLPDTTFLAGHFVLWARRETPVLGSRRREASPGPWVCSESYERPLQRAVRADFWPGPVES